VIISKIYKGQGFGNQLWCMTAAYALSKYKKFDCIFVDQHNSFLGHDIFDISKYFFKKYENINYRYFEKGYFDNKLKYNFFFYDKEIAKVKPNTEIIGNFQSEKYLFNKQNQIKSFFKINQKTKNLSLQFKNFNILNIRGGEYKPHKNLLLPDLYWINVYKLLKQKSDLPIIIVSDDFSYSKKLFPRMEIISNDIQLCFAALMGSKDIALSNSSFSYFPLFYGNKKNNIYAPFQWARFNNPYNLWASPCNYYENWKWINIRGELVSKNECKKNIIFTLNYLDQNASKVNFTLPRKKLEFIIFIKKIIKKFYGYINWRYK